MSTHSNALAIIAPQNFDELMRFAETLAQSDLVPKDYQRKPGNCIVAIQWGAEIGLHPMQALQNIAAINGRPALWGDAMIALVRSSPLCESIIETDDGNTATIRVRRRGDPTEHVRTFSMEDAKAAGLTNKQGPWTTYPKRMRQMRARAFALRDVFTDVLRGIPMAEELQDIPTEKHMGPADVVGSPPPPAIAQRPQTDTSTEKPAYTEERFAKAYPGWVAGVAEGRGTTEDIIVSLGSKYTLSDDFRERINAINHAEPVIAARMNAANTEDELNIAAGAIDKNPEGEVQARLNALYETRLDALRAPQHA